MLREPETARRIIERGGVPDPTTPQQYTEFIRADRQVGRSARREGEARLKANICVLPGDGIGVEVIDATLPVLEKAAKGFSLEFRHYPAGGAALRENRRCAARSNLCGREGG